MWVAISCVCVCGFPPSDPPHTQAIPWRTCKSPPQHAWDLCCFTRSHLPHHKQNNYMSSCAYMGCNLLCVWFPSLWPTTHKQFHAKVHIYGLESLNNSLCKQMCIFPPARSVAMSQTSMYLPVPYFHRLRPKTGGHELARLGNLKCIGSCSTYLIFLALSLAFASLSSCWARWSCCASLWSCCSR